MSVTVVFEAHATSEDNEAGIATGWLRGRLSAAGREQARELGERRRDDPIEVVFTSDLGRAVETSTEPPDRCTTEPPTSTSRIPAARAGATRSSGWRVSSRACGTDAYS